MSESPGYAHNSNHHKRAHQIDSDDDELSQEGSGPYGGGQKKKGTGSGSGGGANNGGGDAPKALNRTSRACNACRKQKMRCVGAEDPPCKRCRTAGLTCLFEKPVREGAQVGEERIKSLETSVSSIQSTLQDLVSTIKSGGLSNYNQPSAASPYFPQMPTSAVPSPSYPSQQPAYAYPDGSSFDPSPSSSSNQPPKLPRSNSFQSQNNSTQQMINPYSLPPNNPYDPSSNILPSISSPSSNPYAMANNGIAAGPSSYLARFSTDGVIESPGGNGFQSASPAGSSMSDPSLSHNPYQPIQPPINPSSARRSISSNQNNYPPNPIQSPGSAPYQPSIDLNQSSGNMASSRHPSSHLSGPPITNPYSPPKHPLPLSQQQQVPSSSSHSHSTNAYLNSLQASSASSVHADHLTRSLHAHLHPLRPPGTHGPSSKPVTSSTRNTPANSDVDSDSDGEGHTQNPQVESELASVAPLHAMGRLANAATTGLLLLAGEGERAMKKARFDVSDTSGKGKGRATSSGEAAGEMTKNMSEQGRKKDPFYEGPGMAGGVGGSPVAADGRMLDCIEAGVVSEEVGRQLVAIYWDGASNFLPIYDRTRDGFDQLRSREPYSLSAMCFVGCRIRDGGGVRSPLQLSLWTHVRSIGQDSLFRPSTSIEAVQATLMLSAWNDAGWLLGGHAVRLAFEVGCHSAFLRLVASGMGANKTPQQLEEDRPLVVLTRVWYALYIVEHQMSYGNGRPPILREDETIARCEEFLKHPLAIDTDWRLVSTTKMMVIRSPIHMELNTLAQLNAPVPESMIAKIQKANSDFTVWFDKWDAIMSKKFGQEEGGFFRESLRIQRAYASLFHHVAALRNVHGPADVTKMTPTQRELAIRALQNAQECIDICLRAEHYKKGLRYAVQYTHVCAAFAASLLVRLARIFPSAVDLRKVGRDVTALSKILAQAPAGRYARSLQLTLRLARRKKALPPPSVPTSPQSGNRALSSGHPSHGSAPTQTQLNTHFNAVFSPSAFLHSSGTGYTPAVSAGPSPSMSIIGLPSSYMSFAGDGNGAGRAGEGGMIPGGARSGSTPRSGPSTDESPQADFSMDDWGFSAELLETLGMSAENNGQAPLWLHRSDIGSSQLPQAGMESFFMPSTLDYRLQDDSDLAFTLGLDGDDGDDQQIRVGHYQGNDGGAGSGMKSIWPTL